MKKFIRFAIRVSKSFARHDLYVYAGDMTFKLILSIFPFILFAFAVVGFLRIDDPALEAFFASIQNAFPPDIVDIFVIFTDEVVKTRNAALLSLSIIIALYSSSSGFASIIKGINNCYGQTDERSWLKRRLLGLLLALLFVGIIVLAMAFMVLGSGALRFMLSLSAIFVIVALIYKIGNSRKVRLKKVLPGTCLTVAGWMLLSFGFNIYVRNFGNFNVLYGSLGSVFLLLVWLNCITLVLLAGAEVNAHLGKKEPDLSGVAPNPPQGTFVP